MSDIDLVGEMFEDSNKVISDGGSALADSLDVNHLGWKLVEEGIQFLLTLFVKVKNLLRL